MNRTKKRKPTYTESDYASGDGMLTYIWGPPLWHFLHTMSFNYPVSPTPTQKKEYRNFVLSLRNVLPCGKCRENLTHNFQTLPLTMASMRSRTTFSKYIYDLHETVNKMLGKPASHLSYEQVRERYEHFRARCSQKRKKGEKGCTESYRGARKTKCLLHIVPLKDRRPSLSMNKNCFQGGCCETV
jgi:hypothetical protein